MFSPKITVTAKHIKEVDVCTFVFKENNIPIISATVHKDGCINIIDYKNNELFDGYDPVLLDKFREISEMP